MTYPNTKGIRVSKHRRSQKTSSLGAGLFATDDVSHHTRGIGAASFNLIASFALAIAALLTLAYSAAPASAAVEHQYETSITEAEPFEEFVQPWGLALDSSGNLFVADSGAEVVDIFSSSNLFTGNIGKNNPKFFFFPEEFTRSVAVSNTTKDVYVAESGPEDVFAFKPLGGGKYEELESRKFEGFLYVALDNSSGPRGGDVYVMSSRPEVSVVAIKPNAEGKLEEPGTGLQPPPSGFSLAEGPSITNRQKGGLAVNPVNGEVYIANPENQEVNVYGDTGTEQQSSFTGTETPAGFFEPIAVGIDPSSGEVYVVDGANHVVDEFTGGGNYEAQITEAEPEAGNPEPLVDPLAVAVGSAGQVYVSDAGAKAIDVYGPEAPLPPTVEGESVTQVTDDSATFNAEINPRSAPTAPATEYRFQYGACGSPTRCASSGYELSTAPVSLTPSFESDPVSAHVSGLRADTAYHFRVIAENAISRGEGTPAEGTEETFTTRSTGPFALPDARQWEMVSPPDKHGALIQPIGADSPLQAAADGDAITYSTASPTEPEPPGYTLATQVLSTRGGAGGPSWGSRDLAIPHSAATGVSVGRGGEHRFFSDDLSLAALQPFGRFEPSLSPEASEQTAFLGADYLGGASRAPCTSSCYRPLVTGKEGYADVPPGTHFSTEGECPTAVNGPPVFCGPEFRGATPDLSHVVLRSKVALKPEAGEEGLYEWSAAKPASEQLALVNVLPEGGGSAAQPTLGISGVEARHAISDDGSRVFFTAEAEGEHLYMRDTVRHRTLRVDLPEAKCVEEGTCGEGVGDPEFQAASSDGSRVFFTDTQKLTADGAAYGESRNLSENPNGADLYECDIVEVGEEPKCDLTDLAPSGAVLGALPAVSEDGSWVYFVANGVLAEGAVHGTCRNRNTRVGSRETCNLYVRHGGATKLVAVLSGADVPDWSLSLTGLSARVSPDGEWFAFMSNHSLTGYDNRDALSGKPDEEVFLYDARSGGLACASCDPTGARPQGLEVGSVSTHTPLALGVGVWGPKSWLAANVPAWTPYTLTAALYQSRYLSNSGRLFFNASDALVPKDGNATEDVYEYEPEGVGSCSSSTSSGSELLKPSRSVEVEGRTVQESAGCVGLISSGNSLRETSFLDASESGDDVFFLTAAQLSNTDTDTALDVYDARVGGGESEPVKPVECEGDACQQPVVSPDHPTPGTSLLNGPGNVRPIRKHHHKHKKKAHKKKRHAHRVNSSRGGRK